MELNLEPVQVVIDVETPSLERSAFYSVCFITENDTAERTIEISSLSELVLAGYPREGLAYNLCVGFFIQEGIDSIFIRAKRSDESYEEAFAADDNDGYYHTIIESKDLEVLESFSNYLLSSDSYKLLYHSHNSETLSTTNSVSYYQNIDNVSDTSVVGDSDYYLALAYSSASEEVSVPTDTIYTVSQLQSARLAYPEAAWVARCGKSFPSTVQWLYKYLSKVDTITKESIPDGMTTTSTIIKNKSTVGSGMTNGGVHIHEYISLDWVKWAMSRRVWSHIYSVEKVNSTQAGGEIIVNIAKEVLNVAVEEGILSTYKVTDVVIDSSTSNISFKFTGQLVQTITNVSISGSIYY